MQRRRVHRTMARPLRVLLLAAIFTWSSTAFADGIWSGYWATTWRDGGASLLLDQQGDKVSGSYPLYGGRIDAVANGPHLVGRWFEGDNSGSFIFVMGRDRTSFSGRYDTGEWWTGTRTNGPDNSVEPELTSPREVFRRFIVYCNLGRSVRPDAWGVALQTIDFGADASSMPRSEQLQRVRNLFGMLDLTTFRVWSIPEMAPGSTLQVRFDQSGTDASVTLTMTRDAEGHWRIKMPSQAELAADRGALLAGRGGRAPAADAYRRLQNPRDTMRAFLDGMTDWSGPGRALALSALDLSGIPEALRDAQGALAAQYLRRVLDQIGLIGLQSIPNDGADRTPYVHFDHPAGSVVIAPSGPEPGAEWKFTAATVADIDDLFRAINGLPPPLATPPGLIPATPFFTMRDFIQAHAPGLLRSVGSAEYWQMIGAALLILLAGLIGMLGARLIRLGTDRLAGKDVGKSRLLTWALAVTVMLLVIARFAADLGAPEEMRRYTYPVMGTVLTVAGCVAIWHLLGVAGVALQRLSDRTAIATDDILFTLLLAGARLGVIVAAFLGIAYFLSIPTSGILAGLGIGGLAFAFASRETLSNVFGAGILVADRPFKRGDWISSGDIDGSVEHVGIRSTRVRTAQDSVMVVPNGKLADSTINNLGTRRHRLLKTQFIVTAGGTPRRLDLFADEVRRRITADDSFVATRTDVGLAGIAQTGMQVEVTTYLNVSTVSEERAAKHALLVDVVRLAERCGLTLGLGMLSAEQAATVTDAWREL
jgi:MscS family membrane protein